MNLVDVFLPVRFDRFLAFSTLAWSGSVNFSGFGVLLWHVMILHVSFVLPGAHWCLVWTQIALVLLEGFHKARLIL